MGAQKYTEVLENYKEIIENYREIKDTLNTKKIAEYISNFAIENHLYDVIMKEVF